MQTHRGITAAYTLIAALHLVPIWAVTYLPTADGPAHLYNAWIISELVAGEAAGLESWYRVDWRPHPNWLGHAFLAAAMLVVPAVVAEKLLVSAIVILFLAGAWMLAGAADERSLPYAFLAFPLTFNLLLQAGLYNFSIASGLYLITVAAWWRRRDEPTVRTIALVAMLLVLCYFAHPLPAALAMGSIGILWLAILRCRPPIPHLRHLAAFVPATLLLLWFAAQRGTGTMQEHRSLTDLLDYVSRTSVIFTFDVRQFALGRALFIVIAVLLTVSIVRENIIARRVHQRDAFLLLLGVVFLLYLRTPAGMAGGLLLAERLSLFIPLLVIPAISPNLPRTVRTFVAVVLAITTVANLAFLTTRYRQFDRRIASYLAHLAPVKPGSSVLPLEFEPNAPGSFVNYYSHAIGYVAVEKRLIDLDNYEPGTDYFPTAWAPGVDAPDIGLIEARPHEVDVNSYAARAEYISAWKLPDGHPTEERIRRRYRLLFRSGDGRLYMRHTISPFEDEAMVLLPFAGTVADVYSAGGARWRIEQQMTNTGPDPAHVTMNACALTPACDVTIAPGQTIAIASADQNPPFAIVHAERSQIDQLDFSTTLLRTDERADAARADIRAVREADFQRGTITIPDVPISPSSRLNLRVWTWRTPRPAVYRMRVTTPSGQTHVSHRIGTRSDGFNMDGHLVGSFPELQESTTTATVTITLEDAAPDARVWGFITATTDNVTDMPSFHMPGAR